MMSTLAAPERNEEAQRQEPPLTAEGLLRRPARQRAEALALSDPPNTEALKLGRSRSYSYSYGEADAAVDALASFFIEIGLEPGDKIAVLRMLWRGYEIGKVCGLLEP